VRPGAGAPDIDPAAVGPAFIHESAARESAGRSNERLEFFGDAILGFVAARWIFQVYPAASEGEMARRKNALVSGEACAQSARRLGFGELLVLGVGMSAAGGTNNASILADAFEAFIAALYLATDLATVGAFIEREHLAVSNRSDLAEADAKTALQELTQARYSTMPVYIERAEGPAHDRRFTSQVRLSDEVLGEGIGSSKKAAQLSAAAMALAALRRRSVPEAPSPAVSNEPPSDPSSDGRVIAFRARRKPHSKPKAPI
jgi:ribonuclease-3